MANPRRSSYSINVGASDDDRGGAPQPSSSSSSSSAAVLLLYLKHWLKKPHAFPILLSVFLLLTWLSLVLQQRSSSHSSSSSSRVGDAAVQWRKRDDEQANLVRFKSESSPSPIAKDNRGWLLDPVALALEHGVKGGAVSCASVHLGEIRPGTRRGNHRHHACNETFVIWGAKTLFRLENHQIVDKRYAEVIIGADEVAVAASPSGTAHALVNMDSLHSTFFIGCQDCITNPGNSSDYRVWHDL